MNSVSGNLELKSCFTEPLLTVMNFLNEVVEQYPDAISFAPGRPAEELFEVEKHLAAMECFLEHRAAALGTGRQAVLAELGQYGRTNGLIHDLIARHLAIDESIHVAPEAVMITTGAQEAMAVLLAGLFDPAADALLVSDPRYIGITGLARLLGVTVIPIASDEHGCGLEQVALAAGRARRQGLRARVLYLVPDFNNPLGCSLPIESAGRSWTWPSGKPPYPRGQPVRHVLLRRRAPAHSQVSGQGENGDLPGQFLEDTFPRFANGLFGRRPDDRWVHVGGRAFQGQEPDHRQHLAALTGNVGGGARVRLLARPSCARRKRNRANRTVCWTGWIASPRMRNAAAR